MATADEILRLYRITDPEMYEASRTKRSFFLEDKVELVAFDSDFADPFVTDWLTEIEAAEAFPQDEALDDQLTQLTAVVEEKMESCRDKFQSAKYFIEKAFPKNAPVWNEFGYDNYKTIRRVQNDMVTFMKQFHSTADKYKVQLIASGYTQPEIDEIDTLRTELIDANTIQENFIGDLPVKTQARHIKNNEVWNIMVKVCTAGKTKFRNDFARYQRYLLPPGEESPEALSILGLVTDQANGNPLQGATLDLQPVGANTTSAANGRYSFGGLPDGNYTLTVSLADYVTQHIPVTITGGNAVEVNVHLVHV
ncbi:MAG: carboxypeptidase-like regulatory domain-containing protein [Bacteroidia bacterium]